MPDRLPRPEPARTVFIQNNLSARSFTLNALCLPATGCNRYNIALSQPDPTNPSHTMERPMRTDTRKLQVLHILRENLKNPSPQAVRADDIASRLQLSLPETQLLLKVMTDMGVIESSVDSRLALITRKGLHSLQASRPATV